MNGVFPSPSGPPWHAGEREAQRRAGVAERMGRIAGRSIRPFMPDQHRQFFSQLPFLIVGSVDDSGLPWASLLAGPPGFATTPDERTLQVATRLPKGDPLHVMLRPDAMLGILGIELATRRRNRINGRVIAVDDFGFSVTVDQSFGNCPQYIQRRETIAAVSSTRGEVEPFTVLSTAARTLIQTADTFFVATFSRAEGPKASQGVDVVVRVLLTSPLTARLPFQTSRATATLIRLATSSRTRSRAFCSSISRPVICCNFLERLMLSGRAVRLPSLRALSGYGESVPLSAAG